MSAEFTGERIQGRKSDPIVLRSALVVVPIIYRFDPCDILSTSQSGVCVERRSCEDLQPSEPVLLLSVPVRNATRLVLKVIILSIFSLSQSRCCGRRVVSCVSLSPFLCVQFNYY